METIKSNELCKILNISRPTLKKFVDRGMPVIKLSESTKAKRRFDLEAVKAWIKENY